MSARSLFALAFLIVAAAGCGGGQPIDDVVAGTDVMDVMDDADGSDVATTDVDGTDVLGPDVAGETVEPRIKRLHTRDTSIVDEDGNVVILKGVNLGGYLYHETWLTLVDYSMQARAYIVAEELDMVEPVRDALEKAGPQIVAGMVGVSDGSGGSIEPDAWLDLVESELRATTAAELVDAYMARLETYLPSIYDDSDLPIFAKLEERFGADVRDSLLDTYLGAWIQESDIQWISEQGFNLVRVPIGYRSLTTGSHLAPPTDLHWNEATFARLEALLDWCEKWGVYAVIDIQECPGGQNDYSGPALLYTTPIYQDMTVDLWTELSSRFIDRNIVAAYSLLAEPMGAPSRKARDDMYDLLVKAIRENGDDHMLVIHDGFKGMDGLPDPDEYSWTNVIYSTHIFEWSADSLESYKGTIDLYDWVFNATQEEKNVPFFIGSFSGIHDEPWAYDAVEYALDWYAKYGWSWSLWTYKGIQDPIAADIWNDKSSWGLKSRLAAEFDRPDLFVDDQATLAAKFASYADMDLLVNETLLEVLKGDLGENVM